MADSTPRRFDHEVAVVGLGAFGAAALWQLAKRGVSVIGIEQFQVGHDRGSTHGASRVFRVACMEHPDLAPLAARAAELWQELEMIQGEELLRLSGALMIGAPGGDIIRGALNAAASHNLPIERFTSSEVREKYPLHGNIPDDYVAVWDPNAGAVRPERGVVAAVEAAKKSGATVLENCGVEEIIPVAGGGVELRLPNSTISARKVIVAAGAWLGKLLPELPLTPRRTPMMWFNASKGIETESEFNLEKFPVFIREINEKTSIWGHGAIWGHGVKIGLEDKGPEFDDCDPDTVDRGISPNRDWQELSDVVSGAVQNLDPIPARAITCMITNTPDMQFTIGALNHSPDIIAAGGCSGHGFKHASAIGEHLAEIALEQKPTVKLEFANPNRF